MAVLLVVLVLPFLLRARRRRARRRSSAPRVTAAHPVAGFWISPRQYPDFGWTLLSRILVNFGNAFGTTLLLYFLRSDLKVAQTPRTTCSC